LVTGPQPITYLMPDGPPSPLSVTPRLESWNRADHPDQVRLGEFVAHVRDGIDPILDATDAPLTFRLDIGLPDAVDPLWERDLDNYLFPIARELPDQIVSFWATKARAPVSTVRLEPAVTAAAPAWLRHDIPRALGSEAVWKEAMNSALVDAAPLPIGPVGVQLSLTVGTSRRWTSMWKRSIDGMEPLLGRTYPDRRWNPLDGRIVRLGLHRHTDPSFDHDAQATVWASPAELAWPELAWLAAMTDPQRAAFLTAHQAKVTKTRAAAGPATQRTAAPSAARASAAPVTAGGISPIDSEATFDSVLAANTPIVITDTAGPPKLHMNPARCGHITKDRFRTKVIVGAGKNGRYFQTGDPAVAKARWPRLSSCRTCSAPV
jgi:hypothetical protein